jgi:hypothetical protein
LAAGLLGVVVGDQVAQDLGVGLGLERVALAEEEGLDLAVVLDDAVVDQGELAVAAHVGVGVGVGHAAVGGPAGVPDPDRAAQPDLGGLLLQVSTRPTFLTTSRPPPWAIGEPRGVVAAVFEALQALEDDGRGLAVSDVADDAAHGGLGMEMGSPRRFWLAKWDVTIEKGFP